MKKLAIFLTFFSISSSLKIPKNDEIFVSCDFRENRDFYLCDLTINNPDGLEFDGIDGEHLPGFANGDVKAVNAFYQNTRNIPQIICNLFPNLVEFRVEDSNVEELTSLSFAGCRNLESLKVSHNLISITADGVSNLSIISLSGNHLRQLPRNLFNELNNLTSLNLGHNQLTEINLNSFGSSISSLNAIFLNHNEITSFDPNFIEESENLNNLHLYRNPCAYLNYVGVRYDRERVRRDLQECHSNFGFIECFYVGFGDEDYICVMNIENPTGRNTFDRIDGTHEPNRSDYDVTSVTAMLGNTLNVPSIICQQFPNLHDLSMRYSRIEEISYESFMNCLNLRRISLDNNLISTIPDITFAKKLNLEILSLNDNRISRILGNPFIYSPIEEISLERNQLTEFDPASFSGVFETLRNFFLSQNKLTSLPSGAFREFLALRILSLNGNLMEIPADAFSGARNLIYLNLGETGLRELNREWFNDLISLQNLRLYANNLEDLPENIFNSLHSLTDLDISRNQLFLINTPSFGQSLNTLRNLFLEGNQINFFDPEFLASSPSLNYLFLSENLCVNSNFINVGSNLDLVRNSLGECVRNFGGFLRCSFFAPGIEYTCGVETMNLFGRDDFERIEGNHHEDQTDSDVIAIIATNQHSRTIPSILCRTFTNTLQIVFENSRLEEISHSSFENCKNLEFLALSMNRITEIPDQTFTNNPNLMSFLASFNIISKISNSAFRGTSLNIIDLDYNQLTEINSEIFNEIDESLNFLFLGDNLMTSLPDGAFKRLTQVLTLNLANNPLGNLPNDVFHSMVNLDTLIIHDCEISELSSDQFEGLNSLKDLRLAGNHLTQLPDGIFNNLFNLTEIDLDFNEIFEISASIFGTSITNIQYIFAWSNNIFGIDSIFFENASELRWLFLRGNICVEKDFFDVLYNRDGVRVELNECLTNFNTTEEISCNFIQSGEDYYCMMSVFNPGGRKAFESVNGSHLEGFFDSNVTEIYIINQNSRVFPNIVCRVYENLMNIFIIESRLKFLDAGSFEGCESLEILLINYNHIVSIPDGTFSTTPNLFVLQLVSNLIMEIGDFAFTGSSLMLLDVSGNFLTEFNPRTYEAVNSTLFSLLLPFNQISTLPRNAFRFLSNLEILQLNYNPFNNNLPRFIFSPLRNLQALTLINCGLSDIDITWFQGLSTIREIHLSYNEIEVLPAHTFEELWSLDLVNVANNNLEILSVSSFGSRNYVNSIYAYNNNLLAIEQSFVTSITSLDTFLLRSNICINQDFTNIQNNQSEVRNQLDVCFTNYQPPLTCHFMDGDPHYECNLILQNPAGVDNFRAIEGEHFYDKTDEDVGFVQIYHQNTRNFPSLICRKFENLKEIFIDSSDFSQLNEATFADCLNLTIIYITNNPILKLQSRVFSRNSKLQLLYLIYNQMTSLSDDSLDGARVKRIFLEGNQFTQLESSWFAPVSETLEYLDVSFNPLQNLTENSFGRLENLQYLFLDVSNFTSIGERTFAGLPRIHLLALRDSQITEFNSQWFSGNSTIRYLYLDGNLLTSLPDGAFDNFPQLELVSINRNQLTSINSVSFGRSLTPIAGFYALNNKINAIDSLFIDNAENLNYLYLSGNVCISQNFINVMENLEGVRSALEACFNNFEG